MGNVRESVTSADGEEPTHPRAERAVKRLVAGRYLLAEVLGKGGMGTVWRAHDQLLDRPVAAKELHFLGHAHDAEEHRIRMRRAIREARTVARVPHPHVVGVHDLVEFEGRLWIVMELVPGPSLAHRIADSGPLEAPHTAAIGVQLLDALAAVHAAGALHRDVKPANVLMRGDADAVLTDFGIAALDDGESLTTTGELIGSLEYIAPERMLGADVGPASDLWSLGATLAMACGGRSPFRKPAQAATLHAVVYDEPALPERLGPLHPVVAAMLRKDPRERPSAAAVRSALERVAAGESDAGPLPSATVRVIIPRPSDPGQAHDRAPGQLRVQEQARIAAQAPAAAPTLPVTVASTTPPTVAAATDIAATDIVTAGVTVAGPAVPGGTSAAGPTVVGGPPRRPRRNGRRRLAWTLAGAVVTVAAAAGGLLATGVLSFGPTEKTTTAHHVVRSTQAWQPVKGIPVRRGDKVSVRVVSGSWTVDYRNMPMTGPTGYDAATDHALAGANSCKVKSTAPFGTLLARLVPAGKPAANPPVSVVGRSAAFRSTADGTLELAINDADSCVQDNRGSMAVQVRVTHRS